jgi:hypothetical protein
MQNLEVISEKIVKFSHEIDTQSWIDLIEKVAETAYPFISVNRRPHLTMALPFLYSKTDNIFATELRSKILSLTMPDISKYMEMYNIENMELKKDFISISKLQALGSMRSHKDDKSMDSNNFICMLYINDDFDGGDLEFPLIGITYKPKAGDVVIYQSKMRHGVTQLLGNDRYNLGFGLKGPIKD